MAGSELDILYLGLTSLVEALIGEDLPLVGQVSMVVGVSIIILLVVAGDLVPHQITTVLKCRPLISEAVRLLRFERIDGSLHQEGMVPLIEVILHLEGRHLSLRVILVDPLVKINISTQMLGLVLRGHTLTWNLILDILSLVLPVCVLALTITTIHFREGTALITMTSCHFLEGTATETLLRWGVLIHGITTTLVLVVSLQPQINMVGAHSDHIIEAGILDLEADILEAVGITTRW